MDFTPSVMKFSSIKIDDNTFDGVMNLGLDTAKTLMTQSKLSSYTMIVMMGYHYKIISDDEIVKLNVSDSYPVIFDLYKKTLSGLSDLVCQKAESIFPISNNSSNVCGVAFDVDGQNNVFIKIYDTAMTFINLGLAGQDVRLINVMMGAINIMEDYGYHFFLSSQEMEEHTYWMTEQTEAIEEVISTVKTTDLRVIAEYIIAQEIAPFFDMYEDVESLIEGCYLEELINSVGAIPQQCEITKRHELVKALWEIRSSHPEFYAGYLGNFIRKVLLITKYKKKNNFLSLDGLDDADDDEEDHFPYYYSNFLSLGRGLDYVLWKEFDDSHMQTGELLSFKYKVNPESFDCLYLYLEHLGEFLGLMNMIEIHAEINQ